jgi:hypothetical protein
MQTDKRRVRQQKELSRLYQTKPQFNLRTASPSLKKQTAADLSDKTAPALNRSDLRLSLLTTGFLLLLQLVVSRLIR